MKLNLNRYLSIGTICTIHGYSDYFMIIGYKKNLYSDELLTYDYEACIYPYGTLMNNICFNANEIKKIIFEGYNGEVIQEEKVDDTSDINSKERIVIEDDIVFVQNDSYNQLLFDKDGNILIAESTPNSDEVSLKDNGIDETIEKYRFDENGILIAINEDGLEEKIQPEDTD